MFFARAKAYIAVTATALELFSATAVTAVDAVTRRALSRPMEETACAVDAVPVCLGQLETGEECSERPNSGATPHLGSEVFEEEGLLDGEDAPRRRKKRRLRGSEDLLVGEESGFSCGNSGGLGKTDDERLAALLDPLYEEPVGALRQLQPDGPAGIRHEIRLQGDQEAGGVQRLHERETGAVESIIGGLAGSPACFVHQEAAGRNGITWTWRGSDHIQRKRNRDACRSSFPACKLEEAVQTAEEEAEARRRWQSEYDNFTASLW